MRPSGPVFDAAWRRRCHLVRVSRSNPAASRMIQRHYLGKWPGVCTLCLVMMAGSEAVGIVVYALPPRETAVRYGGITWELARLWISDDIPANAETWAIAASVRYIKRECREVRMLVSYADPSAGHVGTIYSAANWARDGRTDGERKSPRFDYADATTGKKYSRRCHVPDGVAIRRVPRVSKHRFTLAIPASPTRHAAAPINPEPLPAPAPAEEPKA